MILKFVLFTLLIFSLEAYAISFQFYDGCHAWPKVKGNMKVDIANITVGELTIEMLEKFKIPYIGNQSGLNSFYNSPTGLNALEALSDTVLRAYGPCYMLDGEIMSEMPDEVQFNYQNSKLIWFLGYAVYDNGVWKSYCVPSHKLRSKFICGKRTRK